MNRSDFLDYANTRPLGLHEVFSLVRQGRATVYESNIDGFASYRIQVPNDCDFIRMHVWVAENMTAQTVIIADYPRMMISLVDYPPEDAAMTVLLDYLVYMSEKTIERHDP